MKPLDSRLYTGWADVLAVRLSTPAAELDRRAADLFYVESGREYPCPLVLCGAGLLGKRVLHGLRSVRHEPVAFADNRRELQGTQIDGIPVMSPNDAVDKFRSEAVFVVTVFTARQFKAQLLELGVRPASSRSIFFQHPNTFLPYLSIDTPRTVADDAGAIIDCLSLWVDETSTREFVNQVSWHLLEPVTLDPPTPAADTYFPPDVIRLSPNEFFVDCGAYNGDTIREILRRQGSVFTGILALEPDPENFANLNRFVGSLPPDVQRRIETKRTAIHSRQATLRFASSAGAASSLLSPGDIEVNAEPLDEILAGITPTFIKIDIEGSEPAALAGAKVTLREKRPTLAVCLYHKRDHLWSLPISISRLNPDYRLHLRRHSDDCWETVCYAVPSPLDNSSDGTAGA